MDRFDFVSPEGLRVDGRRPAELRQLRCKMTPVPAGDGSAFLEMGNTKVLAVVYGPHEPTQRSARDPDRAVITCEYQMASFATGERRKRGKGDRQSVELASLLRQTLESVILTELYPQTQIHCFVQVLQSDGGARAACFNATVLALADAGVAMRDLLATCSAGYLEGTPLLDLNYLEEGGGGPDMCVGYHPTTDKVALMQMDNKLTVESLEQVIELSTHGCKVVAGFMRTTILEHTQQMAAARGPVRL
mmetsp:Transcript_4632/g.7862  ORF Transcript_4632/g.7862 Transcript_4632/m.7862 type:complete len:248 (-) Transcript_4632:222-965(-)